MEEQKIKPKKKKNYRAKTSLVQVRYTHEEIRKMKEQAKTLGHTNLSKYVRTKIDNGTITVRYIDTKFDKVIFQLSMIGNNLRQSVHLFYKYPDPSGIGADIQKTLVEINDLLGQTRALLSSNSSENKPDSLK